MKKLLTLSVAAAVVLSSLAIFSSCGTAEVVYSLSEDGTHYIVSGVSGNRYALKNYDILSVYDDGEHGSLSVTEIASDAFNGCSLISVTIPDTITTIGARAFAYNYLNEITIPDSVTYIGYAAFAYSSALETVVIPESVTELAPYAFAYCQSLESAIVNANIDTLYIGTFQGIVASSDSGVYTNTNLTEITLPATITSMHTMSFGDNFITDIYFGGTAKEWQNIDVFYAEEQEVEGEEEGETETETVVVHLSDEEKIDFFSVEGMTIHTSDADLVYSNGEIQINYNN